MTNNIEQIEELLQDLHIEYRGFNSDFEVNHIKSIIMEKVESMQSQIDALTKEADADESRESESL